ncbi:MAG TPA: helix-hairpin-helix domain-containing protein [Pyrinomonadaceae bacterium]|nr:helix-hairpin-helix domain-containing protein [Pyrinomonadaceae bacterium]
MRFRLYIGSLLVAVGLLGGCKQQAATSSPNSNKQSVASSSSPSHGLIDINSASRQELETLQGVGEAYAQRIIDHRPYREKNDLVRLKVIPESTYHAISDKIIAHQKQ